MSLKVELRMTENEKNVGGNEVLCKQFPGFTCEDVTCDCTRKRNSINYGASQEVFGPVNKGRISMVSVTVFKMGIVRTFGHLRPTFNRM